MASTSDERAAIEGVRTGLLVGGAWRSATGQQRFAVEDPATGATLTHVADATQTTRWRRSRRLPSSELARSAGTLGADTEGHQGLAPAIGRRSPWTTASTRT